MNDKLLIIEYVTNINPAFATHPSLSFFTDKVMEYVSKNELQDLYIPACAYLVCHKLQTLELYNKATSGVITREKLGDQEIQYNNPSGGKDKNPFITGYYQEYLNIINNNFGGFVV